MIAATDVVSVTMTEGSATVLVTTVFSVLTVTVLVAVLQSGVLV